LPIGKFSSIHLCFNAKWLTIITKIRKTAQTSQNARITPYNHRQAQGFVTNQTFGGDNRSRILKGWLEIVTVFFKHPSWRNLVCHNNETNCLWRKSFNWVIWPNFCQWPRNRIILGWFKFYERQRSKSPIRLDIFFLNYSLNFRVNPSLFYSWLILDLLQFCHRPLWFTTG
jgi:hypothetical protein